MAAWVTDVSESGASYVETSLPAAPPGSDAPLTERVDELLAKLHSGLASSPTGDEAQLYLHLFRVLIDHQAIEKAALSRLLTLCQPSSVRLIGAKAERETATSYLPSLQQLQSFVSSYSSNLPPPNVSLVARSRYQEEFVECGGLGRGGFGAVFMAQNKLDGVRYAIKKVVFKIGNASALDKLLREVRALARLDHMHIVRYNQAWIEYEQWDATHAAAKTPVVPAVSRPVLVHVADDDAEMQYLAAMSPKSEPISLPGSEAKAKPGPGDGAVKFVRADSGKDLWSASGQSLDDETHDTTTYHNEDRDAMTNNDNDDDESEGDEGEGEEDDDDQETTADEQSRSQLESQSAFAGHQSPNVRSNPLGVDLSAEEVVPAMRTPPTHQQHLAMVLFEQPATPVRPNGQVAIPHRLRHHSPAQHRMRATLYIQMQLCGTRTLKHLLENNIPAVHRERNLAIFRAVLCGVAHVHERELIHRDLKPSNIFLCGDDGNYTVKIGDFGLAVDLQNIDSPRVPDPRVAVHNADSPTSSSRGSSSKTAGVGTYLYSAPEQLQGGLYDCSADIFSIGVILFEMLCHFDTKSERVRVLGALREGIVPEAIRKDFPLECDLVMSMLKAPHLRPTADEVLAHPLLTQSISKDETIALLSRTVETQAALIAQLRRQLAATQPNTFACALVLFTSNEP